jgi:hypothetical protein
VLCIITDPSHLKKKKLNTTQKTAVIALLIHRFQINSFNTNFGKWWWEEIEIMRKYELKPATHTQQNNKMNYFKKKLFR